MIIGDKRTSLQYCSVSYDSEKYYCEGYRSVAYNIIVIYDRNESGPYYKATILLTKPHLGA